MTPPEMAPVERTIGNRLHTLADIPVSQQDVEDAHAELRTRLRAVPPAAARRTRMRLLAAAAAVVLIAAAATVWASTQHPHSPAPTRPPSGQDSVAIRTASGFVDALSSFDVQRARHLLAPGATVTGAVDAKSWPEVVRFFQRTGGAFIPGSCQVVGRSPAGTKVDCAYSYQLMRSGALGLGPYTGSEFRITTRQGRISFVNMYHVTDANGFSSQMWTPFATWIDTYHHGDGVKMYPDWPNQGHWPATDRAIRLWTERTRQFVRFAHHLCSAAHVQSVFGNVCEGQQSGG